MISPSNLSLHALPQQSFQAFYKLCSSSSSKVSIWAVHPSALSKLCPTSLSNLSLQAFHLSSPSNLSVQFLHPSSLSKLSIQALPLRSVQAFSMFCPSSSFNLYFWALSLQALHLNFSTKLSIQGLNKSSLQALSSLRTFLKCSTSLSGKASVRFKSVLCLFSFWLSNKESWADPGFEPGIYEDIPNNLSFPWAAPPSSFTAIAAKHPLGASLFCASSASGSQTLSRAHFAHWESTGYVRVCRGL